MTRASPPEGRQDGGVDAQLEFQRIRDALANGLTDEAFETADRAMNALSRQDGGVAVKAALHCVVHALMVLPVPIDGQGKRAWASLHEAQTILEAALAHRTHVEEETLTAVGVKALEWLSDRKPFFASTPFCTYRIDDVEDDTGQHWQTTINYVGSTYKRSETEAEAKAAAQHDYETRIRSALVPLPKPAIEAGFIEFLKLSEPIARNFHKAYPNADWPQFERWFDAFNALKEKGVLL